MNWTLLQNSLLVSGLTMALAVGLGFAVALTLAGASGRSRRLVLWLAMTSLALPPFVATNCWLDLLGSQGVLGRWLPVDLYSLGGAVWLLTLLTWPITTLLVSGVWSRVERCHLESDPVLRGFSLIRWLLWPMARGAVGCAAVIVFVLALNNFAVPVILQVPVFPEELWLALTTRLGEAGAWTAAWPLVAAPVALLVALKRSEISWPEMEGSASAQAIRRQLGRHWFVCGGSGTVLLLLLSVGLPLGQLTLSARTWAELPNLFRAASDVIGNSFVFAAFAATACVTIGLLSWRLPFGGILWLPFLIPGVLLARATIFVLGGSVIYGTIAVVLLTFTIRYLAFGWNGAALVLRSLDRDVADAARLDGARGWALLWQVHWPRIAPQIAGAWYVTYLLCLWDVETLVLIYPPGGETLALRIFNLLHYGHHAQVNALCLTLLGLALLPLLVWESTRWLNGRRQASMGRRP